MRNFIVLLACLWAYAAAVLSSPISMRSLVDKSEIDAASDSHQSAQKVRRDTGGNEMYRQLLVDELLKELQKRPEEARYASSGSAYNKRWQPMGGPLPVETRLSSFGSRIEPDRNSASPNANGFKAMRYGRR